MGLSRYDEVVAGYTELLAQIYAAGADVIRGVTGIVAGIETLVGLLGEIGAP